MNRTVRLLYDDIQNHRVVNTGSHYLSMPEYMELKKDMAKLNIFPKPMQNIAAYSITREELIALRDYFARKLNNR